MGRPFGQRAQCAFQDPQCSTDCQGRYSQREKNRVFTPAADLDREIRECISSRDARRAFQNDHAHRRHLAPANRVHLNAHARSTTRADPVEGVCTLCRTRVLRELHAHPEHVERQRLEAAAAAASDCSPSAARFARPPPLQREQIKCVDLDRKEAELERHAAAKQAAKEEALRELLTTNGGWIGAFNEEGRELLLASQMLTHTHVVKLTVDSARREGWTRVPLSRHGPELRNHFGVIASVPGLREAYEAGGIWEHCDLSVSHDMLPLGKTTHDKLNGPQFVELVRQMLEVERLFDNGALDLASLPAAVDAAAVAAEAQAAQLAEAEAAAAEAAAAAQAVVDEAAFRESREAADEAARELGGSSSDDSMEASEESDPESDPESAMEGSAEED